VVNQYNGTGLSPANSPTYNGQYTNKSVATPSATYNAGTHNVIPELNKPNFINQSFPNDTSPLTGKALSGSPCTDGLIDVKMTESNVPSYIPAALNPLSFVTAPYINKEAEIEFESESQSNGAEPFVEPLPNPASETGQLVNEANGNLIGSPFTLSEVSSGGVADPTTVSGSITLPTAIDANAPSNGNIGVEITPSNTNTTYNSGSTPPYGIGFFHVWTDGTNPPYLEDAWVASSATTTCPNSPASASSSNFVSGSSSTSIQLCANVVVPSGTTCSTLSTNSFSLQLSVNGGGATTIDATHCTGTTTSGTNTITTWTFPTQSVGADSGGTIYSLGWKQTKNNSSIGTYTGCKNGGSNPCTGSFGTMQQVFSGAYDSQTAQFSGSGTTLSVAITGSAGSVISSESNASLSGQTITVTVHSMSFDPASCTVNASNQCIITASNPVVLSFGGNQGNAALECNGVSEGNTAFQNTITTGCPSTYGTTTGSCPNTDNPPSCATENPGSKLNNGLDPGMTARVYCGESITTTCNVNKCPTAAGTDYNYWVPGNSLNGILNQHPADPRLITLLVTDNGGLGNGANKNGVPIREFATFYVTGWAGDPCTPKNGGGSGTAANGFAYAADTDPSTASPAECDTSNGNGNKLVNCNGVLLGYFVKYLQTVGSGTGSGKPCGPSDLTPCVPVFLK
jgi:hypothetical protein